MNKDDVIRWAAQARLPHDYITQEPMWMDRLTEFAKLVRSDYSFTHAQLWLKRIDDAIKVEREACAAIARQETFEETEGEWTSCAFFIENKIRERGES